MSSPPLVASPHQTLLPNISRRAFVEGRFLMGYPPGISEHQRDIRGPHPTIRVNEWGPPSSRRVLCVPGMTTPSIVFYNLARRLATDVNCRVMTFDLWGTGYSGSTRNERHDLGLYLRQTELVLEQAGWGAKNGINFDIIAYSSGAPIALEYCNRHGADVRFVALIGPAGVSKQIQGPCDNLLFKAFLKQPSLVPQQLLRNRIAKLLGVKDTTKTPEQSRKSLERVGAEDAQDGLDRYMSNSPGWSPLAPRQVSHIDDAVSYQIMHHDGFLYHVCSALRDGPVAHQKTIYRTAFRAFRNSRNLIKTPEQRDLTVFLAEDDKSARPKDVKALMEQIFGPATLESFDRYCRIQNLDGGHHHMPTRECDMIFDTLSETWF